MKLLPEAKERMEAFLEFDALPDWARKSIEWLEAHEEWESLNNRFYRDLPFGTAGMRGATLMQMMTPYEKEGAHGDALAAHAAVGTNTLNDFLIIRATIGLFRYCQEQGASPARLVIAHDVRFFSKHFAELTASTWGRLGGQALLFSSSRSTPQLSFTLRQEQAHVGVVITASHNPPHDNGYKIYFKDGGQAVGEQARLAIKCIQETPMKEVFTFLEKRLSGVQTLGKASDHAYLTMLKGTVLDPERLKAHSPKLVFTPLHGTGAILGPELFRAMGIDLHVVEAQMSLDPRFLTVESPNPESNTAFTLGVEAAKRVDADLIIAFDPDADRMGVAVKDAKGSCRLLSGNTAGALLAAFRLKELYRLGWITQKKHCVILKSFVTTPFIEKIAHDFGIKCVNVHTGFKWIGEKLKKYEDKLLANTSLQKDWEAYSPKEQAALMQEHSRFFVLGAEESFGLLVNDAVRDKDAHSAALAICELFAALKEQGKTLLDYEKELYLKHGYYAEDLLNLYYPGSEGSQKIQNIIESYRNNPPKRIGNASVVSIRDFKNNTYTDEEGDPVPSMNVFVVELSNGASFAVRASGTEPKIKYYLFGHESVHSQSALEPTYGKVKAQLSQLKKQLTADAQSRAEA